MTHEEASKSVGVMIMHNYLQQGVQSIVQISGLVTETYILDYVAQSALRCVFGEANTNYCILMYCVLICASSAYQLPVPCWGIRVSYRILG